MNNKNIIKILNNSINLKNLSLLINIKLKKLIIFCKNLKLNININQILNNNIIKIICNKFNYKIKFIKKYNIPKIKKTNTPIYINKNIIVGIIGHVDHGKTTFINKISNKNITSKERGHITQKNNIYTLKYKKNKIIFIDTPGHKDFINLKYQCLKIIDIILIFISCDINVIPKETKKILNYINKYNKNIIFVISKIDILNKKNNIKYIINYLIKKNYTLKKYGGKYLLNKISSKKNIGIKKLINNILLLNNNKKYLTNPSISSGYIINSYFKKNIGYIQTIILKKGNFKIGDYILCNNSYGKIKKIFYKKKNIKKININIPIKIIGLKNSYNFGEKFYIYNNIKLIKKHIKYINNNIIKQNNILQNLKFIKKNKKIFKKKKKHINIILKANLLSSIDAIINIIDNINHKFKNILNIINYNIEDLNNNDIKLAQNTNSIIINFNKKINKKINKNNIKIKNFYVIYEIYKYLNKKIKKHLKKKICIKGVLLIKKIYIIKNKYICGCYIQKGIIKKKYNIRVIRNKKIILKKSKILTLKKYNKNIDKIKKGNTCGLIIKNFNKALKNDTIEVFK
ncbi:MAG: GTP-binding protein [Candidatus Shikimatogenerans sp. Tduv]|uniref:GTP-binding protein n=1 Tax=Candidatus Shikimatogenerans sp. Tduv TaxID=3158567 RepID=A0AAU7QQV1_9FLAO